MSTWLERVRIGLLSSNGGFYHDTMRRSLQSLVLYEAHRILLARPDYGTLRPFQKRGVFFQIAVSLTDSLDFMNPGSRRCILWKTMAAKENLDEEIAWRRAKNVGKAVVELAQMAKDMAGPNMSHADGCELILLKLRQRGEPNAATPPPTGWEHSHCHYFTCYKIYYRGGVADAGFPEPYCPVGVTVPTQRPATLGKKKAGSSFAVGELLAPEPTAQERQQRLNEVRTHLQLLQEFEGIIPAAELTERKRQLFASLPEAPPAAKKARSSVADMEIPQTP